MSKIIVTVTRPELTEEERQAKMEEIKEATVEFMRAVEKGRNTKDGEGHSDR